VFGREVPCTFRPSSSGLASLRRWANASMIGVYWHRYAEAAAEFQKILDHRGIVGADPIGALVHLKLAELSLYREITLGRRLPTRSFLALWNHADEDIPVLQQAKAEYAKLP
jgi:hypothetical protein